MYKIFVNDKCVANVDRITFVKVKPSSGALVPANGWEDAQGVVVSSVAYNLPGHTEIAYNNYDEARAEWVRTVQPEAFAIDADLAKDVYLKGEQLTVAEGNIAAAEDALAELDVTTDDRMAAIEDAICELDEKFGGAL